MLTMRALAPALVALMALAAQPAWAAPIQIANPVLRVASPVSKTGAGYLVIRNKGPQPDRLLAVKTAAANRSDLHGTVMAGSVMQMRAQADGVPLPAGSTVRFAPGGLHIMFIGLKGPVPAGRRIPATLQFQRAGAVEVMFVVQSAATP